MSVESIQITELLERIDAERMVIPDFQRGFKWRANDVRKLLESLLLDYPIGSALLWRTQRGTMSYRRYEQAEFDGGNIEAHSESVPMSDKETEEIDFVLDGQQRTTSIHKVFARTLAPTRQDRDGSLKGLRFFFDLTRLGLPVAGPNGFDYAGLQAGEICSRVNKLTQGIQEELAELCDDVIVTKTHSEARKELRALTGLYPQELAEEQYKLIAREKFWLPLTRGFLQNECGDLNRLVTSAKRKSVENLEQSLDSQQIEKSNEEITDLVDAAFEEWQNWFTREIQGRLNRRQLPCIVLQRERPEGLARIFETINSTGMTLSVFDLMVARLGTWSDGTRKDINLRQLLKDSFGDQGVSVLKGFDEYPSLGGTISQLLPRVLALHLDIELKKGAILSGDREKFQKNAPWAADGMAKAVELLRTKCGVLEDGDLPFKDALTLAAASYPKQGEAQWSVARWEKIVPPFLCTVALTEDWTSSTNTTARSSYKTLIDVLKGNGQTIRTFVGKFEDLPSRGEEFFDTDPSSVLYKAIITWVLRRCPEDWLSKNLEDHHIFPRAWIKKNRPDVGIAKEWDNLTNCVLNRALVPQAKNQKITDSNIGQYLERDFPESERRCLCLPDEFLKTGNYIDENGTLALDGFKKLLIARYKLICDELVRWVMGEISVED